MATNQRLAAAAKMQRGGESMAYVCGMYNVTSSELHGYMLDHPNPNRWEGKTQGSLFGQPPAFTPEKSKLTNIDMATVEARVAAYYAGGTKPHLSNSGGIRGHSAGDIFPYIIVLVGSFVDGFNYYIVGQGRTVDTHLPLMSYTDAHEVAVHLLKE